MKAPEKLNRTRWLMPDREWLEHQHFVLGKPYKQMAEEAGCNETSIQCWARKNGVSWKNLIKEGEIHPPFKVDTENRQGSARFYGVTRKWLIQEYFENKKSAHQIGQEIGASWNAVIVWLKKYNLEPRNREEINKRHSDRMSGEKNPSWVDGSSRNYHYNLLKRSEREYRCEWCGCNSRLQVHHRNHDVSDGDLDNLAWLCGLCNRMEAQLYGLHEKGRAEFWFNQKGNLEVSFS